MKRDQLLEGLTELALRCGRGAAYDIRGAAGIDTNTKSSDEPKMREFIERTLAGE